MVAQSIATAWPVFNQFGVLGFIIGQRWSPAFTIYGAWPFVFGTLVTSIIALVIAVPIAVLIALLVTEFSPHPGLASLLPSAWTCWQLSPPWSGACGGCSCSCRSSGRSSTISPLDRAS